MIRINNIFWVTIIISITIFFLLYKVVFFTFCEFYSHKFSVKTNIEEVDNCKQSFVCEVKKVNYNENFEIVDWQCWRKNIYIFDKVDKIIIN